MTFIINVAIPWGCFAIFWDCETRKLKSKTSKKNDIYNFYLKIYFQYLICSRINKITRQKSYFKFVLGGIVKIAIISLLYCIC